ncbi:pyridoxamine 5'-phosphate oxidase family protein [Fulvivirga sp.]|uniref:pyridoxamine 5'-phosphate oxidase family protein n=1 Tax=Fulvivirga sp. TaxID=1931237 RepID=UPI0032EB7F3B
MIAALNRIQIDNVLYSQIIGRIGCCANNKAYVVPITYAYNGEYIYCHTIEGMKVKFMRSNPLVCFEVERIENMAHWQSVILWGKYEELEGELREEGLQILVNRVHPLMTSETIRPRFGLDAPSTGIKTNKDTIIFRIKPEEATGKFEKR